MVFSWAWQYPDLLDVLVIWEYDGETPSDSHSILETSQNTEISVWNSIRREKVNPKEFKSLLICGCISNRSHNLYPKLVANIEIGTENSRTPHTIVSLVRSEKRKRHIIGL